MHACALPAHGTVWVSVCQSRQGESSMHAGSSVKASRVAGSMHAGMHDFMRARCRLQAYGSVGVSHTISQRPGRHGDISMHACILAAGCVMVTTLKVVHSGYEQLMHARVAGPQPPVAACMHCHVSSLLWQPHYEQKAHLHHCCTPFPVPPHSTPWMAECRCC
jgi:hypothetical protein